MLERAVYLSFFGYILFVISDLSLRLYSILGSVTDFIFNIIRLIFVGLYPLNLSIIWAVLLITTTSLIIKRNKITKYYIFTPTDGLEGFDRIIDKMKDIPAYIVTLLFPTSLFIDAMLCITKSQILGFIKYQLFSYIAFIAGVTLLSIFKYVNMKFPNSYKLSSSDSRKPVGSDIIGSSTNKWSYNRRYNK